MGKVIGIDLGTTNSCVSVVENEVPVIIPGTSGPEMKVFHERPIPSNLYPEIDTDLARDNLENDIPAADLENY